MTLTLRIRPGDPLPIYRQIYRQVVAAIAGGRLRPGDQMPGQRELAETLVIAPLTVKRAYDELERDGYVEGHRGRGTFVRDRQPGFSRPEAVEALRAEVRALLNQVWLAGIPWSELLALLEEEQVRLDREQRDSLEKGR
ncbi:MAG: GntR family transcriptional regulator [Planctomycetota bacterium]|nr:MAG: GntR family transcriptional regulator [Planctomycetota bacterium]